MIYVGIDPGKHGGVSYVDNHGSFCSLPMPDIHEFRDLITMWGEELKIKHVFLEKAQAMPKQGVSSMFNYGSHFGQLQGVLIGARCSYSLIPPQEWQKEMFKGTMQKLGAKVRALEIVKRLFPKERFLPSARYRKPHDGMIDSILLAECCRRKIL